MKLALVILCWVVAILAILARYGILKVLLEDFQELCWPSIRRFVAGFCMPWFYIILARMPQGELHLKHSWAYDVGAFIGALFAVIAITLSGIWAILFSFQVLGW